MSELELSKKAAELEARVQEVELREKNILTTIANNSAPVGNRSGSDEARALAAFGCSHVKSLLNVNVADVKFQHVAPELKGLVLQLKQTVDVARMVGQVFHGGEKDVIGASAETDRIGRVKNILESRYAKEELVGRLKAFGSTVSGAGDEWVPTLSSSSYVPEYELEFLLESKMKQVSMLSNPFDMSIQSGVTKARKIAENTQATAANFGTGKIQFSAIKSVEYFIMPEELSEDSAPDIMAVARDEVVRAQIRAIEAAIINGDDDGTHLDSDTQALGADVAEKFWKGLRRQAIANSANGGTTDFAAGAVTAALLRTMRARMGKFGVNPLELLLLAGPSAATQLQVLDQVATVDKFGPMATVLKGVLSAYQGIPIITSQYMREDLNATGVYDGVTFNRAGLIFVNKNRWYVGTRRAIKVKIQQDMADQDRWLMASYQRKDFKGHTQSASEVSVSYGYNIAV
jgi:hypothetical protein